MKNISLTLLIAILVLSSTPVFAQDDTALISTTSIEDNSSDSDDVNDDADDDKRDGRPREDFKRALEARKNEFKLQKEAQKEEYKEKREALKEGIKEKREAFKQDRELAREQIKAAVEARKIQFKAEVEAIKKQAVSARKDFVYGRFVSAVQIVKARQERIARLVQKSVEAGKDMSAANSALTKASQAIVVAEASITELKDAQANTETDATDLRVIASEIESALKEARTALVAALDIVAPLPSTSVTPVSTVTQ